MTAYHRNFDIVCVRDFWTCLLPHFDSREKMVTYNQIINMVGPSDLLVYKWSLAAIQHGYVGLLESLLKIYPNEFATLRKHRCLYNWIIKYSNIDMYRWATQNNLMAHRPYSLIELTINDNNTVIHLINQHTSQENLQRILLTSKDKNLDIFVAAASLIKYKIITDKLFRWSVEPKISNHELEHRKESRFERSCVSKALETLFMDTKNREIRRKFVNFLKHRLMNNAYLLSGQAALQESLSNKSLRQDTRFNLEDFNAFDILWSRTPEKLDLDNELIKQVITCLEKGTPELVNKYYVYCRDVSKYALYKHLVQPYILKKILRRVCYLEFSIHQCRILKHVYKIDTVNLFEPFVFYNKLLILNEETIALIMWICYNLTSYLNDSFWNMIENNCNTQSESASVRQLMNFIEYNRKIA